MTYRQPRPEVPTTRRLEEVLSAVISRAAVVFLCIAPSLLLGQTPARLPGIAVTAERVLPGSKSVSGFVTDTVGVPVEGVEISISDVQRRVLSAADGSYRVTDVPRGTFTVRARKLGYMPQVQTVVMGPHGSIEDFSLIPHARTLPPVVTSAARGGIGGTVVDTAYAPVISAEVRLLSKSTSVLTDSSGRFYLQAPSGSYMVGVTKVGFKETVVSVTVPPDSGRNVSLFLAPFEGGIPAREAWNIVDMGRRLAWRNRLGDVFYTREDMLKLGAEWAYQLVRWGGQAVYDEDCSVIVNGGPSTVVLNTLTIDDLEAMEIYNSARAGVRPTRSGMQQLGAGNTPRVHVANSRVAIPQGNTDRALAENRGKVCPLVYVWTRQ